MNKKEKRDLFEKVGRKMITRLEGEEIFSNEELNDSWKMVEKKVSRIQQRKRISSRIIPIAAILGGVVFLGYFIYYFHTSSLTNDFSALLPSDSIDYNIKDITLFTENNNVILKNESEIKYDEEGKAIINKETLDEGKESKKEDKQSKLNQIIVPNGKRTYLTFTDGTRLSVNSGSFVAYPTTFNKKTREIYVQGEVFLEVAKDSLRPFIVKTEYFDIKVLGTSFNICAYKNDREASVVLVEGAVEMTDKSKSTVKIKPGEKLSIEDGAVSISSVDVNEYILWKDNILYLGNYKYCGEILNRLSRHYGIKIEYDDHIKNIPIGGKLDVCETIEDALDIIVSISTGLNYHKDTDGKILMEKK